MKLKSLLILSAFAALPVFAGLQRGPIVPEAGRSLIVDFNHDGLDDAIDSALDGTHLLLNSGGVLVRAGDLPIPGRSTLIAAADVNGDGNVDILASSVGSGTPGSLGGGSSFSQLLYLGNGGRSFSAVSLPTGWTGETLADVDGDGKAEVVLMSVNYDAPREHSQSTTFSFLRALPDGTFEQRGDVTFPTLDTQPLAIVAGDLNNDGHIDLVVRLEDDLLVFLGRGDFTFEAPVRRFLPSSLGLMPSLYLRDIDGDGNLDLTGTKDGAGNLRVFFGDGRGGFSRAASIQVDASQYNGPRGIGFANYSSRDRFDVISGTNDGDLVVLSMKDGALAIVSRTPTGLRNLSVVGGAFRSSLPSDIYVQEGVSLGTSVLFYSTEEPAASAPRLVRSSRGRAVIGRAANQPIVLRVAVSGECVSATETWELTREGFFATIRRDNDSSMEAFFENDVVFMRISRPGEKTTRGALVQSGSGHYVGQLTMNTSCGSKSVWIDALVQQ